MRRLGIAVLGGLAAAVGALVAGQNQPGFWLAGLMLPGRRPSGYDIFIFDRYLIADPLPIVLDFFIFTCLAYATVSLWLRLASQQGRGNAGA